MKDDYVDNLRKLDLFAIQLAKGNWDYNPITTNISKSGKTYELG